MMTSKRTRILVGVLIVLALGGGLAILLNPLRRPEADIRESLLRQTPLGTSFDEVHRYAKKKGWLDLSYFQYDSDRGFHRQGPGEGVVVGVTSIKGKLGSYSNLFTTEVSAYWGFDPEGKLIDIQVEKITFGI